MSGRRAVIHCNAGNRYGRGHLMRSLAIAQTARTRGWVISIIGDIDDEGLDLVGRMAPGLEVSSVHGSALASALIASARVSDVVHIDSYWTVPDLADGAALVSNMQDGPYGVRPSRLAIDANLGAERSFGHPEWSGSQLAGVDLAVIREQVLRQRSDPSLRSRRAPRILVVMGGTDPQSLTERVVHALGVISHPLEVTVVDPRGREGVREAAEASPHDIVIVGFVDDLPALARRHDLAVTASGTSVWDFACMGLPMALVCAVDNQRVGYREVVERGLAIGLGEPPYDELEARIRLVEKMLRDEASLAESRERLMRTVDGLGTWRILSAWEQLIDVPVTEAMVDDSVSARRATRADAQLLFDWRNDQATRSVSRSREELDWDAHRGWLERTLTDPDRRLFVFESDGNAIGTCRWDRHFENDWEISITVAPEQRGRGVGSAILAAAERTIAAANTPVRMLAVVHVDNASSTRLFQRSGYLPHRPHDDAGFVTLAKWDLSTGGITARPS